MLLPHFRLHGVVSLHMCVLPYKYREILEMLPKLTELCELMGSRQCHPRGNVPDVPQYVHHRLLILPLVWKFSLGRGSMGAQGAAAGICIGVSLQPQYTTVLHHSTTPQYYTTVLHHSTTPQYNTFFGYCSQHINKIINRILT